jgi:ribosomal protein S8
MAVTLSAREKKQWEEIKALVQNNDCFDLDDSDAIRMKRVLDLLQKQGYIKSLDVDGTNMFLVLGNFQDFDEWLKDEEKESLLKEQQQRQRHCQETRQLRASSIVNSQPIINGVHIMDAASEEILHNILSVYDGNANRIVQCDSSIFPAGYRNDPMATQQEMEKLSMYGMVTSTMYYKNSLKTVLTPQGLTYFDEKERALKKDVSIFSEKPLRKKYDVFISHANKDKLSYVNDLYSVLSDLGIEIFYDSKVLSWGDKWKDVILNGTEQSEFAIIVISENFFGREWTEKELNTFLEQENTSGQKIVLPLLYNVTINQLKAKYPALEEIQAISTSDYTKEQIAILFAQELIKRYK